MVSLYFKDKIIRVSLTVSAILNLSVWLLFYFKIPIQVEPIILGYNIYVGINLIGPWFYVYYFSLAGLIILILNFFLSRLVYFKERWPALVLVVTALACQIILTVYAILLVVLNN
jgi:hypothetical protein